jgi:hypothetical protein
MGRIQLGKECLDDRKQILTHLMVAVNCFPGDGPYLGSQLHCEKCQDVIEWGLLADLEQAHQQLQEYAAQAEELAAARERHRKAPDTSPDLRPEKDLLRLEAEGKIRLLAYQVPSSARCALAGIFVYWRQAEGRPSIHGS